MKASQRVARKVEEKRGDNVSEIGHTTWYIGHQAGTSNEYPRRLATYTKAEADDMQRAPRTADENFMVYRFV